MKRSLERLTKCLYIPLAPHLSLVSSFGSMKLNFAFVCKYLKRIWKVPFVLCVEDWICRCSCPEAGFPVRASCVSVDGAETVA